MVQICRYAYVYLAEMLQLEDGEARELEIFLQKSWSLVEQPLLEVLPEEVGKMCFAAI